MKIALTFDDGPSEQTTRILNILTVHDVRVSFFVLGGNIRRNVGKVYRAWQMGCEIICHAWEHKHFIELKKGEIKKSLNETQKAISAVTGKAPPLFRPPYGEYDEKVAKVARRMGMSMVNWSLDTKDWESKDADKTYSAIMDNVKDGDIILCHDVYDSTVQAMSRAIPDLITRGYEFITVTELLISKFGKLEPGEMYYDPE